MGSDQCEQLSLREELERVLASLIFVEELQQTEENIGVLASEGQGFTISNTIEMEKAIKIVLAILFFLCLLEMPYGFYQIVRFAALVGFAILAYQANQQGRQAEMIIYAGLALLFQPFFKIALGRQMWIIVDVVVGLGLLVSIFLSPKADNK